jgi:hypothetical protein
MGPLDSSPAKYELTATEYHARGGDENAFEITAGLTTAGGHCG